MKNLAYYPNVGVIISAYNVEKYIEQSIVSAASQDYEKKYIFIYCDGCTDNTESIAREVANRYDNIMVISHNTNYGLSVGRNILIKSSIEFIDYYLILDGDDWIHDKEKITKMVEVAISAPKVIGVVYNDYQNYHEVDGKIVREYKRSFSKDELIRECILSDSGTMVSKKAYEAVGLYDESLKVGMDYDIWLRISDKFLIYHVPDCTTTVRIRGNSLSSDPKNKEIWRENIGRVYQKLYQRQLG